MNFQLIIQSISLAMLLLGSTLGKASQTQNILANIQAQLLEMKANMLIPGIVQAYVGTKAPKGWVLCDGSLKSRTQYSALFQVIGYSHGGSGDQFRVPDYRGMFLRGVDAGSGRDPEAAVRSAMFSGGNTGNQVGSIQDFANAKHSHSGATRTMNSNAEHAHTSSNVYWTSTRDFKADGVWPSPVYVGTSTAITSMANVDHTHNFDTAVSGAEESRPKNAYVNYIIKY